MVHMEKVHSPKKQLYKCQVCHGVEFESEILLNSHIASIHKPKPFVCDFCKANFMINDALTSHVKELHKKFKCEKCNDSSYYNR